MTCFLQTPQALKHYYEKNANLAPRIPHGTSRELTNLLNGLLKRNADQRLDFEAFFNHIFIRPAPQPPAEPSPPPPPSTTQPIPAPRSPAAPKELVPGAVPPSPPREGLLHLWSPGSKVRRQREWIQRSLQHQSSCR